MLQYWEQLSEAEKEIANFSYARGREDGFRHGAASVVGIIIACIILGWVLRWIV